MDQQHFTIERITSWLHELERRDRELSSFVQFVNLLQAAGTPREAYDVIAERGKQMFPAHAGAIYLRGSSPREDRIEPVATWSLPRREQVGFAAEECWALKRGKEHLVDANAHGPFCKHVLKSACSCYFCVPMIARGEILGILHLRSVANGRHHANGSRPRLPTAKQQLALDVSDLIARALANLRERELLSYQATRDPLTGLYNRRYLDETLGGELGRARRGEYKGDQVKPVGLIYFDIDYFGTFNKSLTTSSQLEGDAVLRKLADFLQEEFCRRPGDIACRMGGDEFILVLPGASLENSVRRAEELCKKVRSLRVRYENRLLKTITLSLGVASFPNHGSTPEAIIKAAATALARAKRDGRNQVAVAKFKRSAGPT